MGESPQFYRLLFEHARDIILLVSRDGRIVGANEAAPVEAQIQQADTKGVPFEVVRCRKDGSTFPVEVSSQGASIGTDRLLLSIVRDITDRKLSQDERESLLHLAQRRAGELDATIESIPDGVLIYGLKGEIVRMNSAAERMLGVWDTGPRAADGRADKAPSNEDPGWQASPSGGVSTLAGSSGRDGSGRHSGSSPSQGETDLDKLQRCPLRDQEGRLLGAVVVMTDITSLHDLQEQRAKYILGISHGLRTPLTVVQGQAQLLMRAMERVQVDDRTKQSVAAVIASAQRMSVMLRDLVDLMHLESGEPLRLNLLPVDLRSFLLSWNLHAARLEVDPPIVGKGLLGAG